MTMIEEPNHGAPMRREPRPGAPAPETNPRAPGKRRMRPRIIPAEPEADTSDAETLREAARAVPHPMSLAARAKVLARPKQLGRNRPSRRRAARGLVERAADGAARLIRFASRALREARAMRTAPAAEPGTPPDESMGTPLPPHATNPVPRHLGTVPAPPASLGLRWHVGLRTADVVRPDGEPLLASPLRRWSALDGALLARGMRRAELPLSETHAPHLDRSEARDTWRWVQWLRRLS